MKKYFPILAGLIFISCKNLGKLIDKQKSDSYYMSSTGQITFCQSGNWFELGSTPMDADAKSFKVLSTYIAEDKNFVFFRSSPQKQVDRNSFYIENEIPKDHFHAYYIDEVFGFQVIDGADAKTFEYLPGGNSWGRDKDHYFFSWKKLNVDRQTFSLINKTFSEDKDSIYITLGVDKFQSVLPNKGDAKAINDSYIKTGQNVYYVRYNPEPQVVTFSFDTIHNIRIIDDDIICVNNQIVIYYGEKFKYSHVDVTSFQVFPPNKDQIPQDQYSKDKNNVYYNGEIIVGADVNTYTPLGFGFGKDAKSAYYETNLLKGVDAESFKATDPGDAGKFEYRDKLGNRFDYQTGKKL